MFVIATSPRFGPGTRNPQNQPFTSGRLPLGGNSPRPAVHGQVPYNRPIQSRAASGSSAGNHTAIGSTTAPASRSGDTAVIELLHKIMDEVLHGREEYQRLSDQIKVVRQSIRRKVGGKFKEFLGRFQGSK